VALPFPCTDSLVFYSLRTPTVSSRVIYLQATEGKP
jgi:hypothetical protein